MADVDEPGHITCPFCGGMNEASVQNKEEVVDLIMTPTIINVTSVTVVVPVWTCHLCEQSWTNWVAEDIRTSALLEVLDDSSLPTY